MDDCVTRFVHDGKCQTPVAFLVTNFTAPTPGHPSLLTHDDVITLFHEFGHGLHHMLTKIDYPSVAGIHGVPWDAVELPSQFLENWCWEEQALAKISGHVDTGEPLPAQMFQQLKAAKTFQAGMAMMRQLEFGLFDFLLHENFDPSKGAAQIQATLDEVRARVSVTPKAPYNRFQHGFTHVFAGGYAAGYYSYLWAEVLSADAFSAFQEEGIFNQDCGRRFMQCILEQGGAHEPAELFQQFRGRAPKVEPLLEQEGLL